MGSNDIFSSARNTIGDDVTNKICSLADDTKSRRYFFLIQQNFAKKEAIVKAMATSIAINVVKQTREGKIKGKTKKMKNNREKMMLKE